VSLFYLLLLYLKVVKILILAQVLCCLTAPFITGTIFVPAFYILLTSISRSLYVLSFSVCFVSTFELSGMAILISRQVFSFLSCSTISGQFPSIVRSVITGTFSIVVVPLTFMILSGICS